MSKRLKQIIFSLITLIITICLYVGLEEETSRWLAIFMFMIIDIALTSVILDEEPMEFFENFGNYKNAKVSAVLMVVAVIAAVKAVMAFF